MRAVVLLLAACAALPACAGQPNEVNSTPPTVSYRIPNDNVAATNAEAQNYCAQYGHTAQYRGVQAASGGAVAVYTCDGSSTGALSAAPAAPSGSTVPPAEAEPMVIAPPPPCADALHEDRPGGADYRGPPVAGCPSR